MMRISAGLLPYRHGPEGIEVFVAHIGGPAWARKDEHAWSVVKGEVEPGEDDPEAVARREFAEEVGAPAPGGDWLDLGEVRQSSAKTVRAYAVEAPDVVFVASNTCEIEWPPRSGRRLTIPEVDRAEWMPLDAARPRLVAGQLPLLDRLAALT